MSQVTYGLFQMKKIWGSLKAKHYVLWGLVGGWLLFNPVGGCLSIQWVVVFQSSGWLFFNPVGDYLLWKCNSVGVCPSQKYSSVGILGQTGSCVLFGFKYKEEWGKNYSNSLEGGSLEKNELPSDKTNKVACIHVNPPGSSGSLPEMQRNSRTPGSETEPPGCENTKKKNFFFFFFFSRPSFLRMCMVIMAICCWKAINS